MGMVHLEGVWLRLAFDWDGTLVHHGPRRPDFNSRDAIRHSTRRIPAAIARARQLLLEGAEIHIVTGRGDHLRTLTFAQIRALLDRDFDAVRLHNKPEWEGYAALRTYKAGVLNALQPSLYVGDHESDRLAAGDAGVPFMDALDFADFKPVNGFTSPEPLLGAM